MKLGILGCGQMGETIFRGLLNAGAIEARDAAITTRFDDHESELKSRYPETFVTQDNLSAAERSEMVILAVDPASAREVLQSASDALKGKTLVSICAGITSADLGKWAEGAKVTRAMPNTPCLIGEGVVVLSPALGTDEDEVETIKRLFSNLGMCLVLDEKHLDTVTALAAAGPAFAFVILEAFADGAVMMGLPREIAGKLTAQMLQGSARLLLQTGKHPAALKDQVTTPGGITTAGLLEMEDGRIRSTLARSIQKASNKARGLGAD